MDSFRPEQLLTDLQPLIEYRELATGQTLFHKGELTQFAFWLESGQLGLLHYTADGQAVNHYRVRHGESFAEVALFINVYDCTAMAEVPSRVALLPKQAVLEALRQHPDLAEAMMKQLAWRLHQIKMLLELRSIRSARDRVLHYLRLSADQLSVRFDQPLRKIAEDLALTPEALSRALAQLEEEGVIVRHRRMVQFL
ncbi:MAG TPA: Crp/Fnr family transcriptional regulator [Coleofasciculaceae cyanobacterium]